MHTGADISISGARWDKIKIPHPDFVVVRLFGGPEAARVAPIDLASLHSKGIMPVFRHVLAGNAIDLSNKIGRHHARQAIAALLLLGLQGNELVFFDLPLSVGDHISPAARAYLEGLLAVLHTSSVGIHSNASTLRAIPRILGVQYRWQTYESDEPELVDGVRMFTHEDGTVLVNHSITPGTLTAQAPSASTARRPGGPDLTDMADGQASMAHLFCRHRLGRELTDMEDAFIEHLYAQVASSLIEHFGDRVR